LIHRTRTSLKYYCFFWTRRWVQRSQKLLKYYFWILVFSNTAENAWHLYSVFSSICRFPNVVQCKEALSYLLYRYIALCKIKILWWETSFIYLLTKAIALGRRPKESQETWSTPLSRHSCLSGPPRRTTAPLSTGKACAIVLSLGLSVPLLRLFN
jgi:hypothetical protein